MRAEHVREKTDTNWSTSGLSWAKLLDIIILEHSCELSGKKRKKEPDVYGREQEVWIQTSLEPHPALETVEQCLQSFNRKEHHHILCAAVPLCGNKKQGKIFSNIQEIKKYRFHKHSCKNYQRTDFSQPK